MDRVRARARLLSLALFLFAIFAVTSAYADFRFAVIGDSRGNKDGINRKVLQSILEQIKSDDPAFIVAVGDMITGSKHNDVHRKRLVKWKRIVDKYRIPVYVAVGNHEVESELSEDIVRHVFEMPRNGPDGLKELAYSFDYDDAHFVIIDTDTYKNFHRLGDAQTEWLEDDLKKNNKGTTFVFGHEPAFPVGHHMGDSLDKYVSERDDLWRIFQERGVDVYFCGHEHLYNRTIHERTIQIITAGAGAHFHETPERGGFYHYVLVDVKDDATCKVNVKDIEGEIKDSFLIAK